ncbi:hypothetical protein WP8S17C03_30350 [Metapseudomonas otitidis]|uniref:Uncharacterized protein n=1 Tax=Metapseudomonas otitidis TaxID=319939 RepID=A0A6S5RXX5_9GAMM|nr:hypothetical protein [Pseudomonas otitidis]BBT16986.1 hypothetical protein WP8S17C03_30350 [Pseudomonas otitidis]
MSTRNDKIRRQDALRQQAKRNREAAHRAAVGAERTSFITYRSTRADLEQMQQVAGIEERDEAITLAIRYMAGLARRNPEAFLAAMDPRNPV